MTRNRQRIILMALLALATAGCRAPQGDTPSPSPARPTDAPVVILDADPYGAILLDARDQTFTGLRRDGTVVWRTPFEPRAPVAVRCLIRCPDAVLSGSAASINSPTEPDPEPLMLVDGQRRPLHGLAGPKRQILTAASADDFVLASGDGAGQWWLELRRAATVERVDVGGFRTSWQESADGHHALAITIGSSGRNEARWFARRNGAWQLASPPTAMTGVSSCIGPNGLRALLLGQRPTVLDDSGGQLPITDLEQAGTCAWAAEGGIVADLAQGTAGAHAQLRAFDSSGQIIWQREVLGAASVTADPSTPRVAYTALGVLQEIETRTGAEQRAVTGVRAARYDGSGSLVVVWSRGGVTWMPMHGTS